MNISETIRHMAATSCKSYANISRELGKARNYISMMLHYGTTPGVKLMAEIATICGYKLLLVGHGEVLVLEKDSQLTISHFAGTEGILKP